MLSVKSQVYSKPNICYFLIFARSKTFIIVCLDSMFFKQEKRKKKKKTKKKKTENIGKLMFRF